MSLPRYPKYKDSGIEWLGEVPEHWLVRALKRVVSTPITDGPHETPDFIDEGIPFASAESVSSGRLDFSKIRGFISPVDHERFSQKYKPRRGDIFMVKSGATTGVTAIVDNDLDFNIWSPLAAIRCNAENCSRFVLNFLRSSCFLDAVTIGWNFGTQQNIGMGVIENLYLATPTLPEQEAIAAFLDQETEKIDALVEEQRRLIELLKEKRQAVISHAVTKGLNSDAPMQDSGIEWLGSVPSHWGLKATKKLFRLVVEPAPDDNDCELLSIYTEIGVRPRKDLEAKGNKATTTDGYWLVKKDDLIVNKLLAWMGAIGISDYDGVTSPAYDILRARIPLEPRFYDFLFRCGICFSEFRRYSRGIMDMRLRLYFDELGQLPMPYPPVEEQRTIVRYLQAGLTRIDELTAEATRAIDLLEERRTALISAAVTGKIDVRGLATEDAA